ncbi:MAG: response regulator transcription factor [Schleiferiaceae bacterium]|nr:response regulator transcription factor [Schleiferiaceae bacterium]
MSVPTPLKLVIVDDHQIFIDGLKALLRKEQRYQFVHEAHTGEEALAFLELAHSDVDVVITDISMPEMDGVTLTKMIKERYPDVKVLVLSMHSDREIVEAILLSEAEGYILKSAGKAELLHALFRIGDNGTYYSGVVLQSLVNELRKSTVTTHPHEALTPRECEIIQLIFDDKSSQEIADLLFISKRTVDTHRKNILQKTGTKTLIGLLKWAIKHQVIQVNRL